MAITIELYEDFGPIALGRGSNTKLVYEAVLSGEEPSVITPQYGSAHNKVSRPTSPGGFTYTYNRYFYVKCVGDYHSMYKLEWYIDDKSSLNTDLMYTLTDTYQSPINSNFNGTIITGPTILQANVSATGPNSATSFTTQIDGATFYSNYLVLQQRVNYIPKITPQFSDPIKIRCVAWETRDEL